MSKISRLEAKLGEIEEKIGEYRSRLDENPDDANCRVALSSMERHRNKITERLRRAKKAREKEVVEYRLQGEIAKRGGLPLGVLGDLAKQLERQIYAAAYYIRDGKTLKRRVPKDLRQQVELELAGIGAGSTRLYVTGNLDPNLFGQSIFEDALRGTFELLQAEDPEEMSEHAAEVGSMSAEKLRAFLDTLRKNDLTIDIQWPSPSEKTYKWRGTAKDIRRLTSDLEEIQEEDARRIEVEGRITMMDAFGRFKIETDDREVYDCKYPTSLHQKMTNRRLEETVVATLWRHVIRNSATGHEKVSYRLEDIELVE